MNFSELDSNYKKLRMRLNARIGNNALLEITLDTPKGNNDELSFIRLVAWGYVLVNEAGRVTFKFLRQLPPKSEADLLSYLRPLRTWMSHNLSFEKDHDQQTMRTAIEWFARTCKAGTPTSAEHWEVCFSKLASDLNSLLENSIRACDAFELNDDKDRLILALKSQLDRKWEAYKFDTFVKKSLGQLGYDGIDIVDFRNANLDQWRKIVDTSTEESIQNNLTLRVEADILKLMGNALPISAEELQQLSQFTETESLTGALLMLRNVDPKQRFGVIQLLRSSVIN